MPLYELVAQRSQRSRLGMGLTRAVAGALGGGRAVKAHFNSKPSALDALPFATSRSVSHPVSFADGCASSACACAPLRHTPAPHSGTQSDALHSTPSVHNCCSTYIMIWFRAQGTSSSHDMPRTLSSSSSGDASSMLAGAPDGDDPPWRQHSASSAGTPRGASPPAAPPLLVRRWESTHTSMTRTLS